MNDVIVRTGTPADMATLMEMAKLGAQENGMVPFDINQIAKEFWPALHLDFGIVGIVGPSDGTIEGAVLLRITTFWYGFKEGPQAKPMIEERWLWTHQDYRAAKGGRARKLCEFVKTTSDQLGLPLMIGILSNIRLESKIKLYERVFGKPCGVTWMYRPPQIAERAAPSDQILQASI